MHKPVKRGTKITLIVLGVVFGICLAAFLCADIIVSRLVETEVQKTLGELPGCEASCGDIHLRFFSGTASVEDLHFAYHGIPLHDKDSMRPGVDISVDRVDVGRLFYSLLLKKQIFITDVHINHPRVELWLDDEHPEHSFPQMRDTTLEDMDEVIERFDLLHLRIKDACFQLHSLRTKLDLAVDSLSLGVNDLAYDSVFSYCDSVYSLSLAHAGVMLPDGMMRIETRDLSQENQGALKLGYTRISNTMPHKSLGDILKEPCTWMDMQIEHVTTSAFNPIRKALAKDFSLGSLEVVVSHMDIFRDERYVPNRPFPMPQEVLLSVPETFSLGHVDAHIRKMDIAFASTDSNCGKLQLGAIQAAVDNITNRHGATLKAHGGCPVQKGKAKAAFTMTMNKACDFTMQLHAEQINADFLNPFIRPLVGTTFELALDTLDTRYAGNSQVADGTFRMLYHGLEVTAHKEDRIPYTIVTKYAGTINTLANSLIPKSNPTAVDIHPRAYKIEWKRDPWKPFPLYLFGPCINGAVETMLPGLYVHKEVKGQDLP